MKQLPNNPSLPNAAQANPGFLNALVNRLVQVLSEISRAVNTKQEVGDPLPAPPYLKTALPSAAANAGSLIYVTDETGGATIAFSDGTNWRRVQDRNIVS